MFLKKVLNQPNLVGTMLIALMVCGGFVYAFAFDGFNVETATGGEVEAWLAQAGGGNSGGDDEDEADPCNCIGPPGYECETKHCANDEVECEVILQCHTDCGKCYLNEEGRPCQTDVHCINENSDKYVCNGQCYVPELLTE